MVASYFATRLSRRTGAVDSCINAQPRTQREASALNHSPQDLFRASNLLIAKGLIVVCGFNKLTEIDR